jgi:hypothetical protein
MSTAARTSSPPPSRARPAAAPAPRRAKLASITRRPRVRLDRLANVIEVDTGVDLGNGSTIMEIELAELSNVADIRRMLGRLERYRWADGPILAAIGNIAAHELRRGRTTGGKT